MKRWVRTVKVILKPSKDLNGWQMSVRMVLSFKKYFNTRGGI